MDDEYVLGLESPGKLLEDSMKVSLLNTLKLLTLLSAILLLVNTVHAQPDRLSYERWGKFGAGKVVTMMSNSNCIASGRYGYPELARFPALEFPYNPDPNGRHIYYGTDVSFHVGGFSSDRGPSWDRDPATLTSPLVESGDQGHYKYYKGFHFDGIPEFTNASPTSPVALSNDSSGWPQGGWPTNLPTTNPVLQSLYPNYPTAYSKGLATPLPLYRDRLTGFPGAGPNRYSAPGQYYPGKVVADQESFTLSFARNRQDDVAEGHLMVHTSLRGLSWKGDLAEDILFWVFTVTNVGTESIDSTYVGIYANFDFPWASYASFSTYDLSDCYAFDTYDVDPLTGKSEKIGYGWDGDGSIDGANKGSIPYSKAKLTDESPVEKVALAGVVFLSTPRRSSSDSSLGVTSFDAFAHFDNNLIFGIGNTERKFYWWNIVNAEVDFRANDPDDKNGDRIDDWTWERPFPVGAELLYDNGRRTAMTMSTGPFRLAPGQTDTLVCAVIMGENRSDLFKNARLARRIYRSGWTVPKPPFEPAVQLTEGSGRVTLRWGTISENDPLNIAYGRQPFEGYKIFRSTDGGISWGRLPITDPQGTVIDYVPMAQYDLKNGIVGPSPILSSFDRGKDTGLEALLDMQTTVRDLKFPDLGITVKDTMRYSFVDTDVINGLRYSYAVVAYGAGDKSLDGVQPLQNSRTTGPNVITAIPHTPKAITNEDLALINVVPNPYRGMNAQETAVRERLIKFTHLPEVCTIRIFNIAGELIATLNHGSQSSIVSEEPWNLRSSENLEVAPGLYLYHVDSSLGMKQGKLVIIK